MPKSPRFLRSTYLRRLLLLAATAFILTAWSVALTAPRPGAASDIGLASPTHPWKLDQPGYTAPPYQSVPAGAPVTGDTEKPLPSYALLTSGRSGVATATANVACLVREALERNPGVQAAREDWLAHRARPTRAGALDDPMLSYTRYLSTPETRVGPQHNALMLSRKYPGGSKRLLRAKVASEEARAAEQRYQAALREVAFNVREVYYDYYFVRKASAITRRSLELLTAIQQVALVRYAAAGSEQDVLKADVEISKLNERLLELARREEVLRVHLDSLLARPSSSPLGEASLPAIFTGFDRPLSELEEITRQQRQELLAARAIIQRDGAALRLSREEWTPDFTVGLGYVQVSEAGSHSPDAGKDVASVTLGVNLPFFNDRRIQAGVDEARHQLDSAQLQRRDVENRAIYETNQAYFRIDSAQRTVRLYVASLIPQGELSLRTAAAGYPTTKVTFLDYLDAWRTLLELRLGHHMALTEYYKGLAALERATGVDLPGIH